MEFPFPALVGHANGWYLDALRRVIDTGEKVATRGRTTWEILHALTKLPDPRRRVLTVPYRRANPFFQALETVWILAGRADAEWLTYYNAQMAKFLDPKTRSVGGGVHGYEDEVVGVEEHFHGAYGERLIHWGQHRRTGLRERGQGNQIRDVVRQLRMDGNSRRAVMTIHNPLVDNPGIATLDRPCNIAMSYQLRGGRLHAVTFNRSNDLNLGLAFTNICQFTTIQEFIAAALGVDVADYVHFSSSLHVYQDDPIVLRLLEVQPTHFDCGPSIAKAARRFYDSMDFDVYDYVQPLSMGKWLTPHDGWTNIQLLEELGDRRKVLNQEELKARLFGISCPYWSSVGRMAMAWRELRDEDGLPAAALAAALAYLGYMEAKDWQIACLEFLHRWACKRGIRREFQAMILAYVPFDEWPEPVRRFILHDEGEK